MLTFFRVLVAVLFAFALSACTELPRGAAVKSEVVKKVDDPDPGFAYYPVTRDFLPSLSTWPEVGAQPTHGWIGKAQGSASSVIRSGDVLKVSIWDSGESSLLTAPGERVVALDRLEVSDSGTVFLPYVGEVYVAGRSAASAREAIQQNLEAIIPSAQVQLSIVAGRANSVDLVGGVKAPGNYPLRGRNYSVLSLIAAGGGVTPSFANPQVRLIRGSGIYGTSVDRLLANPALDTRLRGGDQVFVEEDRRYFVALGAAGKESMHTFPKDQLSATDATAIVGGINDQRGNPQGVLILREYPIEAIGPGQRGPRDKRVIFALDLTTSDGLFSARQFQINSGDLVYVSESPINKTLTVFSVIGAVFGLAGGVNALSGN